MRSPAETHASVWEIWRMMVSSTEITIIKGRRDLGETGERATPGSATEHFLDLRRLHKRMCVKPFGEVLVSGRNPIMCLLSSDYISRMFSCHQRVLID